MADAKTQYQVLRANFYNKELPNRTDLTGRYEEAKRKFEMHKDKWGRISVYTARRKLIVMLLRITPVSSPVRW